MSDAITAELAALHRKVDGLLVGLLHIMTKDHHMAATRADVLSALDATDAVLKTLGTNVVALGKAHEVARQPEDLTDILTRVENHGTAVTTLNGVVENVLNPPVAEVVAEPAPAAPVVDAPAAPQVAQDGAQPLAPADGLVIPPGLTAAI